MAEVPDDETLAFARRLFDLAREGRADQLGADPALGSPSAVEVARFFELPAMVELLGHTGPASPP